MQTKSDMTLFSSRPLGAKKKVSSANKKLPKTDIPARKMEIPLPSQEAHKHLKVDHHIVIRIKDNLLKIKDDCLIQISGSSPADWIHFDTFKEMVNETASRLIDALEEDKPYPTLFGDLVKFKIYCQTIFNYYEKLLGQGIPKPSVDTVRAEKELFKAIAEQKVEVLNDEQSEILIHFIERTTLANTLEKDRQLLEDFYLRPHLDDHSNESGFSYR